MLFMASQDQGHFIKMASLIKWQSNYDDLIDCVCTLWALPENTINDLLRTISDKRTQRMAKYEFWMTKIVYSTDIKVNHWIISTNFAL